MTDEERDARFEAALREIKGRWPEVASGLLLRYGPPGTPHYVHTSLRTKLMCIHEAEGIARMAAASADGRNLGVTLPPGRAVPLDPPSRGL